MLLYPALAIGFAFVGVPLLVHLINLLRHRKTKWAAMDFLLASYRKQRRWIVLRQLLLLLTRLAVAALLIAVLVGWIGGKRLVGLIGGQTTHHVVVLDDSYSMQQIVGGDDAAVRPVASVAAAPMAVGNTAYDRALAAVASLIRRLATDDGVHQLTVMRASRAAIIQSATGGAADAAADLSGQTITADGRQIDRLMSTRASSLRCDVSAAIELAAELVDATPADVRTLTVVSDFTQRDWATTQRVAEALRQAEEAGAKLRFIDCAASRADVPPRNLAITDLSPTPDVWVAGVPVVMNVTVKNFSPREVNNVAIATSVIVYGDEVTADPTTTVSGKVLPLPAVMIESIPGGQQLTKSFQVFIEKTGTHVVRAELPDDALPIDNVRVSTLPLADAQRVLIVDGDADQIGAYHVASVLDPGSQVRIGAIPEVQPASVLRDMTLTQYQRYRAIYLIDVPEIGEQTAVRLRDYVRGGGGLAMFLGSGVHADSYNDSLWVPRQAGEAESSSLLPFALDRVVPTDAGSDPDRVAAEDAPSDASQRREANLVMGKDSELLGPIAQTGDGIFGLVRLRNSWAPRPDNLIDELVGAGAGDTIAESKTSERPATQTILARGDGFPIATRHDLGRGRVITVTTGLDGQWNNWPGDPTFVVFLLQANAVLFGGAAPSTSRPLDQVAELDVAPEQFIPTVTLLPPADEPPRLAIELEADPNTSSIVVSPAELAISDQSGLDELMTPGVIEWQRTTTDGRASVLPMASVLRVDESDLARVSAAEVIRDLSPLSVEFISAGAWGDETPVAGLSSFLLLLLGLLALLLALEQALAAWASYHSPSAEGASVIHHGVVRHDKSGRRTGVTSLAGRDGGEERLGEQPDAAGMRTTVAGGRR